MDHDIAQDIHAIIAGLSNGRPRPSKISFDPNVEFHDVIPHGQIYGKHPRDFHFDNLGRMIVANGDGVVSVDAGLQPPRGPNARRAILENILRNAAAWETPTTNLLVKISKRKFASAAWQRSHQACGAPCATWRRA